MMKKQIAKAHCSIGELYLTDLCYDDDAEKKCEEAINLAIAADADSLDGQQGMNYYVLFLKPHIIRIDWY